MSHFNQTALRHVAGTMAVILLVLLLSWSARAYWIQRSNNSLAPAVSPEQFRPAADGSRPGPGKAPAPFEVELLPVPYEMPQGLEDKVERAVSRWDRIEGSAARVTLRRSERTLTPDPDYLERLQLPDGRNTIEFLREDWFEWLGPGVIAITIPHLGADGRILEADLFCNARDYRWVIFDREGSYPALAKLNIVDLEAIVTHEMGHMLGLGHSQHAWACMAPWVGLADTRARRLTSDDRAGIRNLYPLTAADQAGPSIWAARRDTFADGVCGLHSTAADFSSAYSNYISLSGGRLILTSPPLAGDTAVSYCLFGSGFAAAPLVDMDASQGGVGLGQADYFAAVSSNFAQAVLRNGAGGTPTLPAGTYDLTATIGAGAMGVLDQGLFVNPPGNNWPLAAITAAQTRIEPGQCAKLDGSASIDPDGSPLTYRWSVSEAPLGAHPRIEGATESIARACPDSPGLYVVRLKVNDGLVDSVAAQVSIRAYHSDLDPDEGGGGPMNCAVGAGGGPGLLALMAALPVGLLIALRRRGLLA